MKQLARFLTAAALLAIFTSGCATHENVSTPMPTVIDQSDYDDFSVAPNPGSLYSESDANYLFADNRARRVGDVVVIKIVENSKAKTKADTTSERKTDNNMGVTDFLGRAAFSPLIPMTGLLSAPTGKMIGAGSDTNLDVTGETKRENTFTASIGARVVKVLSGGLMQVEGAREVRVNQETQILVVRGLIRPRDIGPDNSILSSKMADARIEMYGKGALADKQTSGWLTRLLDNVWPF